MRFGRRLLGMSGVRMGEEKANELLRRHKALIENAGKLRKRRDARDLVIIHDRLLFDRVPCRGAEERGRERSDHVHTILENVGQSPSHK
jgi:hypothetical protein